MTENSINLPQTECDGVPVGRGGVYRTGGTPEDRTALRLESRSTTFVLLGRLEGKGAVERVLVKKGPKAF